MPPRATRNSIHTNDLYVDNRRKVEDPSRSNCEQSISAKERKANGCRRAVTLRSRPPLCLGFASQMVGSTPPLAQNPIPAGESTRCVPGNTGCLQAAETICEVHFRKNTTRCRYTNCPNEGVHPTEVCRRCAVSFDSLYAKSSFFATSQQCFPCGLILEVSD